MKFIVVEIQEGGAQADEESRESVARYLDARRGYWRQARKEFLAREWHPGQCMSYPCGYIFCIHDNETLD